MASAGAWLPWSAALPSGCVAAPSHASTCPGEPWPPTRVTHAGSNAPHRGVHAHRGSPGHSSKRLLARTRDLRGADFRGASLGGTFMLDSCRLDGAQFDEQQLSVLARGSFRLRGSTVGGDDPQTQARELSRLLLSHGRDIDARVRGLRSLLAGELGSAGGLGLPAPDELLRSDEDTPGDD